MPCPRSRSGRPCCSRSSGSILAVIWRRPDRLTILLGLTVLAFAFFAVPTRVHERYAYPFFPLAIIIAAVSWRWRIAYAVASVTIFLNMYVVLTTLYTDNPGVIDWLGIGPSIRTDARGGRASRS